ncbi:MAG: HAD family phosphatase [Bacteroidales bacterium]|jgi:putative hydrolase of the HAD superfamily|nr:HAD family phosphatase [Bacteroidales bacterium]MCK9448405.1 HAD family phosphatase [Bacteroidales bacterium]MDD3700808.1 HAD family phosphatase [Bacteroidales bacterium]MDY0369393.1 HAD family phosphatase [Bacteroidales bacterium]
MDNQPQIQQIIFDFGGVILDIDPQQTLNALKALGVSNIEPFISKEFQEKVTDKFERGILTPEIFRQKVREKVGIKLSDEQIDDAWNALLLDIPKERIAILEEVKQHYKIFLLSNSNEIHYDIYLRDLQLRFGYREFDQLFHKAYFSFDLHLSKPDPEVFEFILNQHQLHPNETLFIDDTLSHIKAARKLGLRTYHLAKPQRIRDLFTDGQLKQGLTIV